MNHTEITPWYRQFWPWLVFSPMLFVVPAGIWMIYISVVTSDGSVIDEVYKDGRSYIGSTEADDLKANAHCCCNRWIATPTGAYTVV